MGEGLGEVSPVVVVRGIELLRYKAGPGEISPEILEELEGPVGIFDDGPSRNKPKRAEDEGPVPPGKSVVTDVAENEAGVGDEFLRGVCDDTGRFWIVFVEELEQHEEEGRGVHRLGFGMHGKSLLIFIVAVLPDPGFNFPG